MVSGYYGFHNLGDEAILAVLCQDLVDLGWSRQDILVLSQDPDQTRADHGVTALPRYDLRQILRRLGSTSFFLSGGGSLLQDVTSKRSIPYYLGLVEAALWRRVPVIMYGQGLGPVQSRTLRSWVGRAFRRSLACSVRDEGSLKFLLDLGISRETITLAADPVFQQTPLQGVRHDEKRLLLNLRPYRGWQEHRQIYLEYVRLWRSQGFSLEFVALGPGDAAMGRVLQEGCPELVVHHGLTLKTVAPIVSGANLFVSMRLHGLIFAVLHDCLPLGLVYDPKVAAISRQLNTPCLELADVQGLGREVVHVLGRAVEHRLNYRRALDVLQGAAMENRAMLARVLR